MNIISRKSASEQGLTNYFTGKACKHGHVAERNVKGRGCVVCSIEICKKWHSANRESIAEQNKRYRAATTEMQQKNHKRYYKDNIVKIKGIQKNWEDGNRGMRNASLARYRAAKLQRTPLWADSERIKKIYMACPPWSVVDHVIPLQGKLVSGLHIHTNLQYLTPSSNSEKSNRFVI